jgi:hypothetical protein
MLLSKYVLFEFITENLLLLNLLEVLNQLLI